MKLFHCQSCRQLLYFENTRCERCGHALGFLPEESTMTALEPEEGAWRALVPSETRFLYCANAEHIGCNWLVPADGGEPFCAACRHNEIVPDLSDPDNIGRWQRLETAKRRLFYTLKELRLPLVTREEDPAEGLAFCFLSDQPSMPHSRVLTGHDDGMITINIAEADDAVRERIRGEMGEPYRTLLGHFRHEVGHWYWDRLVRDGPHLEAFRALFGDEREDYDAALANRYANGPMPDWQANYVSAYASVHPWEDFAETWAHYLHIVDTLETAGAFGLRIRPTVGDDPSFNARIDFDPLDTGAFDRLIEAWIPLTFAINSLNRSLGQSDSYPFVLSSTVISKLGYIHDLVHDQLAVARDAA